MIKILVIGDFHGKFPMKLKKRIKKEDFNLIASPGDYCGNEELGNLFFKHAYGKHKELWEFIGKKKNYQLEKRNYESGVKILKELEKFDKPIIGVTGNWDPTPFGDIGYPNKKELFNKKFKSAIKKTKNLRIIDFKKSNFKELNFVGYPRSTYPGRITKHIEIKKRDGKKSSKIIRKIKGDNKKYFKKLKGYFGKDTIFISHNCPYYILDKIARGEMKGKHYGSWLTKELIKKAKPFLVICGHMHENLGKKKVGKTWVVNPGAAVDGKAAIIKIDENRKKVKSVKFLR